MQRLAFVALWFFVATIPCEASVAIPGVASIARLVGYIACIVSTVYVLMRRRIRYPAPLHYCFAAIIAGYVVSALWSIDTDATAKVIVISIQLLAMMWLMWEIPADQSQVESLLLAYVAGCVISTGGTIYGMITNSGAYSVVARYSAEGFDPNDLAVTVALSIPMSIYLAQQLRGRAVRTLLLYAYPVAALFGVLLTASRGGVLAAVVSATVLPLALRNRTVCGKAARVSVALILIALAVLLVPSQSIDRISTIREEAVGGTLSERTTIWRAGLDQFAETPIAGIGGGAYAMAMQLRIGRTKVSHNTFLTLMVELGLLGILLMLASGWAAVRLVRILDPAARYCWAVLLLTWVVGSCSLNWVYRKPTWLVFALLAIHADTQRRAALNGLDLPTSEQCVSVRQRGQ